MVTKSLATTPFGKKLIYRINGECIWSEYVSFAPTANPHPYLLAIRRIFRDVRHGVWTALCGRVF
jgi:hypothetical protein